MNLHYQILSHFVTSTELLRARPRKHDELGSEEEVETAPEKRLRLAKEYLAQLEEEG